MTLHSLHQPTLCSFLDHVTMLAEFSVLPSLTPNNITVHSTTDCIADTVSSLYSWVIHVETKALVSKGISFKDIGLQF